MTRRRPTPELRTCMSGGSWTLEQKLTATDATGAEDFGEAVAIEGDTLVAGASGEDDAGTISGATYVFVRTGGVWSEQAKLAASDAEEFDGFGEAVAISADTVVAGADTEDAVASNAGAAYVFVRSGTNWSQQQKLTASDGAAGDDFGRSVAVSGDTALVGADDGDAVYVFDRTGGTWTEQQILTASDAAAGDDFGFAVALDGDALVVGASSNADAGFQSGSAYVFVRSGGTWSEQKKLTAGDAALGDQFGYSVAIGADTVAIGSWQDDDKGSSSGSAYVYEPPKADLAVTKSGSADPVHPGDTLTYTITVTNAGPATSTGVLLTDSLPAGVTFSGSTPTCQESAGP